MLGMKDPPVTTTTSGKPSLETSKQPKVSSAAPVSEPLGAVGGPKLPDGRKGESLFLS